MAEQNYKGLLIRHCLLSGLSYRFNDLKTGREHDPRFTSHVFVNEEIRGEAQDKTKRGAENLACKIALLSLQNQNQDTNQPAQPVGNSASPDSPEVLHQRPAESSTPLNSAASDCMAQQVQYLASPGILVRPAASPPPANGAASKILVDRNYVGLFYEFCQRNKYLDYSFTDVQKGPSHLPEFFSSVLLGQRKFPEAEGKSKKEAKKNAAYLALKVLKQEYPGDLELQKISELDEEVEENSPEPESPETISSSAQRTEGEPLHPEGSDSQPSSSVSEAPFQAHSTEDSSSNAQSTDHEPVQSESSDSVVTFRSTTGSGTPTSRPHRRIELAANFTKREPMCGATTEDKVFLQDFEDITRIDSGGYGTVYKAKKKIEKKYYVVKKVKRRSEKDENEIQTLARLQHNNIVRYYHSWAGEDIFTDNSSSGRHKVESLFIQMEWCANGTLESWIKKMKSVDKGKSLHIFRQIINGVEYIHSKNLIHRDLKPANILFAEDMTVKIADFGLVTPISGKDDNEQLLRTAGKGTENYMAPEQESEIYENEVDIFPLGLMLIELFWKFDNKFEEWEKLRNAELPPKFVQQFPSEESIIKKMLSNNPKKRPTALYLKDYFGEKSIHHSKTR